MTPLTVPPQDRADYERLVSFLERVQVRTDDQAAARAALMDKLRRYDNGCADAGRAMQPMQPMQPMQQAGSAGGATGAVGVSSRGPGPRAS